MTLCELGEETKTKIANYTHVCMGLCVCVHVCVYVCVCLHAFMLYVLNFDNMYL